MKTQEVVGTNEAYKKIAVNTKRSKSKSRINKDYYGYIFIAPFLLVLLIFTIYPIIYSFFLSFTKWDGSLTPAKFIGLTNYKRILADTVFYQSILNTVIIWICNVIPQMLFALGLAVILSDREIKGKGFFRWVYYLPNIVTLSTVGVLFYFIMDWQCGALNKMLISMHFLKEPVDWLQNPAIARGTVSFILWWVWFGYTMIIFMAGIKSIPEDYMEAAKVDGASKWQVFRFITLPCLRNTMIYNVICSVIGGLTMFDIPYIISNGTGQPLNKTLTMVMYVYNTTFRNYNFGYGATIGVSLSVIVFICVVISFKFLNRKPLYD